MMGVVVEAVDVHVLVRWVTDMGLCGSHWVVIISMV